MTPPPQDGRTSVREWLARLLLVALSLLVGLAAAELALRRFVIAPRRVYRFDPRAIYRPIPGARKTFRHLPQNGGQSIAVTFNRRGFRGPELREPPSGRIVVYGDSFIEAETSPLEDTFVRRLEKRLDASCGGPFEVVNAGVVGYGPDQVSRRLEDELDSLRPSLVIVAVFADNDFGDLLRNKLYRVGQDGALEDNAFTIGRKVREMLQPDEGLALGWLVRESWSRGSDLATAGYQRARRALGLPTAKAPDPAEQIPRYLKYCREEYEEYIVQGDNRVRDLVFDHYDADIALQPRSPSAMAKVQLMRRVLERIQGDLARRGVPGLVLIIPSPVDVVDHYYWSVDQKRFPRYDPRRLSGTVAALAEKAGLPAVDLYDTFKASRQTLYYSFGDNHWNAAGEDLAAQEVARHLQAGLFQARCASTPPAAPAR